MSLKLALSDEAFRDLYDRRAPGLRAYLRGLVGRPEVADELLQESFLRLLTRAPSGLGEAQLAAYVYRTATRLVYDGWRRRERERQWRAQRAGSELEAGPTGGALGADLERALARLTLRQRSLLWLAYVEGFSHREIARVLRLKETSVKVLLHRSRSRLERVLSELGLAGASGEGESRSTE